MAFLRPERRETMKFSYIASASTGAERYWIWIRRRGRLAICEFWRSPERPYGEAPPAEELTPCKICGRSFFPKVLKKHTPICQKAAAKKRKTFDSSRQRAEGTDIPTLKPIKAKVRIHLSRATKEPPKKQSNWRREHEDFIATIRAAKGITQVIKDGGPLPPPPPPSYNPDYIQCPYCQRRFGENAAERHVKFCREKAARMPKGKVVAEVKKIPPRMQSKPSAPIKKANVVVSPAPSVQSSSSRLPQRSGSGQISGIPSSKPSSGIARSVPSSLTSPPSGVGLKTRPVGYGYGSAKSVPSSGLNRRKVDGNNSRNDVGGGNEVDGGATGKFCHECGTKYPVEAAKFCCECGVRRMCM
ncbi:Zinc finger C2HC domain-containing protein 1A [Merluccius polli]|uniref:Zinc finger C2HC domain-containing protein 1A n=1 Tax=Merluccius polli TaxID=89951 RepID=A0AA47M161_MERPO|nr:Zinc finger C2HC domain-containing protein 1A [Merluccius polli]